MHRILRLNWFGGTLGWLWLLVVMLPIYWVVITSFKTQANYFITNTFAPPASPTLDNYRTVIENGFVQYFLNSVIVTAGAVIPAVAVAFMRRTRSSAAPATAGSARSTRCSCSAWPSRCRRSSSRST